MNAATPLCDEVTSKVLGLDVFIARLAPWSKSAKKRVAPTMFEDERAFSIEMDAQKRVDDWWHHAVPATRNELASTLSLLPDLSVLERRYASDESWRDEDLFALKRFGVTLESAFMNPGLDAAMDLQDKGVCARVVAILEALHPEKKRTSRFYLLDALDDALAHARTSLNVAQHQARALQVALEDEVLADHPQLRFSVHGMAIVPVGDNNALEAVLLQEARLRRTGAGFEVTSAALESVRAVLHACMVEVRRHEARVRARLTQQLGKAHLEWCMWMHEQLVVLDLRLARARLKEDIQGSWPERHFLQKQQDGLVELSSWASAFELVCGVDPRIQEHCAGLGKTPQRISMMHEGDVPIVVTGPNMGGKSSVLKLLGLCQWCAQHAMPVPAKLFKTSMCVREITYIGSDESQMRVAHSGLSSFGKEVHRLAQTIARLDVSGGRALWLLDEFARGTHPEEGGQVACEVVEHLSFSRGDAVVATTHAPVLARLKSARHWRVRGLIGLSDRMREEEGVVTKRGDAFQEMLMMLHEVMDYGLEPLYEKTSVPRDARCIARILGLDWL